ncbi:protein GVQW3-like [Galleria mellonella]|uniref:Protein GVQW3-like n=1 Tax=Galleria mellonella TaxID=7137 RepID=A0ABM3MRS5_GALME|nr:protein GVQW3-like [Galleria mellonella]XP_052754066.1 protein GVQW3-like [Galleria mellonella]
MVYKWYGLFKQGRESIEDSPPSGRPIDANTPEIVAKVEKLVLGDTRLKEKQLTALVGVSETSILNIIHHHLGMTKLCEESREEVMARIVIGDETWVHHYEPKSKQESMHWHKKGTTPLKKCPNRLERSWRISFGIQKVCL